MRACALEAVVQFVIYRNPIFWHRLSKLGVGAELGVKLVNGCNASNSNTLSPLTLADIGAAPR